MLTALPNVFCYFGGDSFRHVVCLLAREFPFLMTKARHRRIGIWFMLLFQVLRIKLIDEGHSLD